VQGLGQQPRRARRRVPATSATPVSSQDIEARRVRAAIFRAGFCSAASDDHRRTRIVIVAPPSLEHEPGDDAAALEVERSRSLRVGLLEAGCNVAVLPVDTFLPDRVARLHPDVIIINAKARRATRWSTW
jgi:hypothetical protein